MAKILFYEVSDLWPPNSHEFILESGHLCQMLWNSLQASLRYCVHENGTKVRSQYPWSFTTKIHSVHPWVYLCMYCSVCVCVPKLVKWKGRDRPGTKGLELGPGLAVWSTVWGRTTKETIPTDITCWTVSGPRTQNNDNQLGLTF